MIVSVFFMSLRFLNFGQMYPFDITAVSFKQKRMNCINLDSIVSLEFNHLRLKLNTYGNTHNSIQYIQSHLVGIGSWPLMTTVVDFCRLSFID